MSDESKDRVMANGPSVLAFSHLIPVFDGTGSVREFLSTVEQIVSIASCADDQVLYLCKCKLAGAAREFVWHDAKAREATTFAKFKEVLIGRFNTEPLRLRIQRFMSARQMPSEELRSFATRVQKLAQGTMPDVLEPMDEKGKIKRRCCRIK